MSALLTIAALVALDPSMVETQVEMPVQPVVKPLKPHQMAQSRTVMQSPAPQVRRINQPAPRTALVRNEPCRRS